MTKKEISPMPEYFDRYIDLVQEQNLFDALLQSQNVLNSLNVQKIKNIGDKVYAPGKWTIKDILQHLIDVERVFAYRALRIARADKTPLPGYDDEMYATNALANNRTLDSILNEIKIVRESTIILFNSFNEKSLLNIGTASNKEMSVLALGFVIAGHQTHHLKVIKERYESLV